MKLVQFGAGNIGRSFIGQLFSTAGWEVVFIDIDKRIIHELNRRGCYNVEIKDKNPSIILVKNVRGVMGNDYDAVKREVIDANLISTAVGQKAIKAIIRPLALGLKERWEIARDNGSDNDSNNAIDIIICENIRNASSILKSMLQEELPKEYPIDRLVGLVETSIGKMVPIMREEEKKRDPLLIYSEAYNTLIVDKKGFRNKIPLIPNLEPKDNMKAWVDRKLFIHNLGHAVLSYIAFVFKDEYSHIWEAAFDNDLYRVTKSAMWESGMALIEEYPDEFNKKNIGDHIDDLLLRFKNPTLGDTIYRVGRDLLRKLGPEDRIVGSIKLCLKHSILPKNIALGLASAMFFKATDENGKRYANDIVFHEREISKGIEHVLKNVCKLENSEVINIIKDYYERIKNKIDIL